MSDRLVLEREQRRMAVVSLIAAVWVLGTALLGVADALGYLAPALVLLALVAARPVPGGGRLHPPAHRPLRESSAPCHRARLDTARAGSGQFVAGRSWPPASPAARRPPSTC